MVDVDAAFEEFCLAAGGDPQIVCPGDRVDAADEKAFSLAVFQEFDSGVDA